MGQTTQALQQVPIYLHQYPLQAGTFVPQSQVTEPRGFMLLPLELVVLIAQQLSDNGRTRDLAAFARLLPRNICYTRSVQQVLFGHITIQSYEQYAALTRILQHGSTQTRCLELSSMVHNVSAVLDTQPRSGGQQFLSRHLLNLYDQCSQLKRITLLGPPDDRRSEHIIPDVEDLYHIETFQTIESLTLTCPLSFLGPSLLSNLPCLKELHIVGGPVLLRMSNITPRSGPYLRCLKWSAETPPTLQVVKWLFAGSTEATGGTITLLTPGTSESELELIRQYALSRKMDFYTQVALNPIYAET